MISNGWPTWYERERERDRESDRDYLYLCCSPRPFGHHSLICSAEAVSSSETALSPAGRVTTRYCGAPSLLLPLLSIESSVQLPAAESEPVAPPGGAHKCAVTLTVNPPCSPSTSRAVGYDPR